MLILNPNISLVQLMNIFSSSYTILGKSINSLFKLIFLIKLLSMTANNSISSILCRFLVSIKLASYVCRLASTLRTFFYWVFFFFPSSSSFECWLFASFMSDAFLSLSLNCITIFWLITLGPWLILRIGRLLLELMRDRLVLLLDFMFEPDGL